MCELTLRSGSNWLAVRIRHNVNQTVRSGIEEVRTGLNNNKNIYIYMNNNNIIANRKQDRTVMSINLHKRHTPIIPRVHMMTVTKPINSSRAGTVTISDPVITV